MSRRQSALLLLFIFTTLFIVGLIRPEPAAPAPSPPARPTRTPRPTSTPEPGGSIADAVPFGAHGYTRDFGIRVLSMEPDATARVRQASGLNLAPEPGERYTLVEVDVSCIRDECYLNASRFGLVGSRRVVYAPATVFGLAGELESGELLFGGRQQGWVAFRVPADEAGLTLRFDTFGGADLYMEIEK